MNHALEIEAARAEADLARGIMASLDRIEDARLLDGLHNVALGIVGARSGVLDESETTDAQARQVYRQRIDAAMRGMNICQLTGLARVIDAAAAAHAT